MKIQLICSDVDGTLLNKDLNVSPFTIAAVQRVSTERGIPFVLASARPPQAMWDIYDALQLQTPLIAFNGALVLDKNRQPAFSRPFDTQIAAQIGSFADKVGAHLGLYYGEEWYYPQDDQWAQHEIRHTRQHPLFEAWQTVLPRWNSQQKGVHKAMLMGHADALDAAEAFLRATFTDALNIYRSSFKIIELSTKTASKATAVAWVAQHFGVLLENTAAFGDNFNDIEMLQSVGIGVAVANAKPAVQAAANHIGRANTDDGVAHFLLQTLF